MAKFYGICVVYINFLGGYGQKFLVNLLKKMNLY